MGQLVYLTESFSLRSRAFYTIVGSGFYGLSASLLPLLAFFTANWLHLQVLISLYGLFFVPLVVSVPLYCSPISVLWCCFFCYFIILCYCSVCRYCSFPFIVIISKLFLFIFIFINYFYSFYFSFSFPIIVTTPSNQHLPSSPPVGGYLRRSHGYTPTTVLWRQKRCC